MFLACCSCDTSIFRDELAYFYVKTCALIFCVGEVPCVEYQNVDPAGDSYLLF